MFFDNVESYERIYSFCIAQQNYTRKWIPIEFEISPDYENYVSNLYMQVLSKTDNSTILLLVAMGKLITNINTYYEIALIVLMKKI